MGLKNATLYCVSEQDSVITEAPFVRGCCARHHGGRELEGLPPSPYLNRKTVDLPIPIGEKCIQLRFCIK
jgi:hypothetical protein